MIGHIWIRRYTRRRLGYVGKLHCGTFHPGELDAIKSRANAIGGAGLRDVLQAILFVRGKIKFERPDGSVGKSPSNGTTLFAAGDRAVAALVRSNLGIVTWRT